jgi:hypothetical protein
MPSRGSVWREVDVEATDYETVIRDLLSGQYSDPVRIVSFNTGEGWSRDVSAEIVEDLQQRCQLENKELPDSLIAFVEITAPRRPPRDSQILPEMKRPEKITLGEMRARPPDLLLSRWRHPALTKVKRLRNWTGQDFYSPPEGWADSRETCTTPGGRPHLGWDER